MGDIQLDIDDKVDVLKALTDVQFLYHEISTQLCLRALDTIKNRSTTDTITMGAVIEEWLRGNYNTVKFGSPTWKKLAEVVANPNGGNKNSLAEEIDRKKMSFNIISESPVSPQPSLPLVTPFSDSVLTQELISGPIVHAPIGNMTTMDIEFSFGSIRPHEGNMTKGMAKDYVMKHWPHGIALIINNEKFEDGDRRKGTEIDEENLVQLFRSLGYIVEVHRDCKAQEIRAVMKEMGGRNHLEYDSFVCCILSHGIDGEIYGTDHIPVSLDDITTELKGGTLANKPKMFFIQACRGKTCKKIIAIEDESERIRCVGYGCDRYRCDGYSIPDESDFFFGYATPRGYVAFRSLKEGSWFISELCRSFASYARFTNLNDLMMITNDAVAIGYEYKGAKQAIEVTTRLRKNVFF